MSDITNELISIVDEIYNDENPPSESKCEKYVKKYPVISEKYPMIIKKVTQEKDFDLERLKWMVVMLTKVESKTISKHEADIEVGEKLVDEHVKPLLEKSKKQD